MVYFARSAMACSTGFDVARLLTQTAAYFSSQQNDPRVAAEMHNLDAGGGGKDFGLIAFLYAVGMCHKVETGGLCLGTSGYNYQLDVEAAAPCLQNILDVFGGSSRPAKVDTLNKLVTERDRLSKLLDALPCSLGVHETAPPKRRKTAKASNEDKL